MNLLNQFHLSMFLYYLYYTNYKTNFIIFIIYLMIHISILLQCLEMSVHRFALFFYLQMEKKQMCINMMKVHISENDSYLVRFSGFCRFGRLFEYCRKYSSSFLKHKCKEHDFSLLKFKTNILNLTNSLWVCFQKELHCWL